MPIKLAKTIGGMCSLPPMLSAKLRVYSRQRLELRRVIATGMPITIPLPTTRALTGNQAALVAIVFVSSACAGALRVEARARAAKNAEIDFFTKVPPL